VSKLVLQIDRRGRETVEHASEAGEVLIGRAERADVRVEGDSVSRRHARIFMDAGRWLIEDLGSRNGTLLNGRRLAVPTEARPGDAIGVADAIITIRSTGQASSALHEADSTPASVAADDSADSTSIFSVLRPASELDAAAGDEASAASRLRLLIEVHRALAGPISRDELLTLILDRAFVVLQPEQAVIFLAGPGGQLVNAAERRSAGSTGTLLVSKHLAHEVTEKGAAALVLDAQADARFSDAQSVVLSGVRSIAAAPLSDAEGCLGMIALYSSIHVRKFSEQDLELLVSLASAAAMRIRNIAHVEAAAARQVVDRELALAREIQVGMLRRRPPERPDLDLAARLVPARLVGGDFYDFLLDGDSLWFIVADVSGKGMAAALLMAVGQTLFRAIAPSGEGLAALMARINRELSRDNDGAMFVTAFAGRLDLRTGGLELANGGHNLPYCIRSGGAVELVRAANGVAFGVVDDADFPVTEARLAPGDALFLYTDGVCDALNVRGQAFGSRGIEHFLAAHAAPEPADDLVADLFDVVNRFAGAAPQEDDITVAVVRYRGPVAP
jgi:serine phosphatase RsbU (regulator of sigma subunit)